MNRKKLYKLQAVLKEAEFKSLKHSASYLGHSVSFISHLINGNYELRETKKKFIIDRLNKRFRELKIKKIVDQSIF